MKREGDEGNRGVFRRGGQGEGRLKQVFFFCDTRGNPENWVWGNRETQGFVLVYNFRRVLVPERGKCRVEYLYLW